MVSVVPVSTAAAQAQAQTAPTPSLNPFPDETSKLGVRRCASVYSTLGQAVSHGSTYTVVTQTDSAAPDTRSVRGVLGMTYSRPDYSGQAAGIILAAPTGDTCEGQMIRVAPFQQPCAEAVALLPQGSSLAGDLSGVPLYNLGGNQGQALLVASGAGCVVVTVVRAQSLS